MMVSVSTTTNLTKRNVKNVIFLNISQMPVFPFQHQQKRTCSISTNTNNRSIPGSTNNIVFDSSE